MIKVSVIILCGLLLARLLRRTPAATRHWTLAVAIACAAAAPLLESVLPSWGSTAAPPRAATADVSAIAISVPGLPSADPSRPDSAASSSPVDRIRADLPGLLRGLWIAGAAATILVLLAGLGRLRWLARRSERLASGPWVEQAAAIGARLGVRRPIKLLVSPADALLVTWGFWRPTIALPARARDWTDDRIRIVLTHELAHIKRADWLIQLAAELLRCIYWFNPVVWIARRRIREESEEACDDEVLLMGVDGPEYARHLLDLVRDLRSPRQGAWAGFTAPAMARPGSLERRVRAMLMTRRNLSASSGRARAAIVTALLAVTATVAAYGAGAQALATVSGAVVDPNNAPVPGVTVSLSNPESGARYEVRSDDGGRYDFAGVRPGQYQLEARFPGFQAIKEPLAVAGGALRRDLALQIGSLRETIHIMDSPGARSAGGRVARAQEAQPPAVNCQPSAVGGSIRAPRKIRNVNPVYPENADGTLQGDVVLEARIGTDGRVAGTKVVGSPHPDLARAAIEAFEQWLFTPTLLNCVPIEVTMTATMHFSVAR